MREKEERERKVQATQEMQLEAYELQCAALAPKIEAMEASWNRLRSISGAQTTEEVIDYFFSLRRKEENMRELVAQVGRRPAAPRPRCAIALLAPCHAGEPHPRTTRLRMLLANCFHRQNRQFAYYNRIWVTCVQEIVYFK